MRISPYINVLYLVSVLILYLSCKKKTEIVEEVIVLTEQERFDQYFILDEQIPTNKYIQSKSNKVPLLKNHISDPFMNSSSEDTYKYDFFKSNYSLKSECIEVKILDTVVTSIDISKNNNENWVKAIPVIIRNKCDKDTVKLFLQEGKSIIIQNKYDYGDWKPIETFNKKTFLKGAFFYRIFPKEYVYTKIPVWKDESTVFKAHLINYTDTIISNLYYME